MNYKVFCKNQDGQVLGLPMYLIIVMIVAVAVIAAVIFMIPQGTRTMNALVTQNPVIAESHANAEAFTLAAKDVVVKVTTNDERADPIKDATVLLVGAGFSGSGTTDGNGEVTISVAPSLGENINEAHIKLVVKATGFEDFEDDQGITVVRL